MGGYSWVVKCEGCVHATKIYRNLSGPGISITDEIYYQCDIGRHYDECTPVVATTKMQEQKIEEVTTGSKSGYLSQDEINKLVEAQDAK